MIAVRVLDTDGDGMNGPDAPVDPVAVRADEAFLDALSGDRKVRPADSDLELARRLLAARREVEAEPFGDLIDVDTAVEVVRGVPRPGLLRRLTAAIHRLHGGAW